MQQQEDILVTVANSVPGVEGIVEVVEGIVDAIDEQVSANQLAEMGEQMGAENAQLMGELGLPVEGEGFDASGARTGLGGEIDVAVADMMEVGNQQQAEIQAFLDQGAGLSADIGATVDQMSAVGAEQSAQIDGWLGGGDAGMQGMSESDLDHDGSLGSDFS